MISDRMTSGRRPRDPLVPFAPSLSPDIIEFILRDCFGQLSPPLFSRAGRTLNLVPFVLERGALGFLKGQFESWKEFSRFASRWHKNNEFWREIVSWLCFWNDLLLTWFFTHSSLVLPLFSPLPTTVFLPSVFFRTFSFQHTFINFTLHFMLLLHTPANFHLLQLKSLSSLRFFSPTNISEQHIKWTQLHCLSQHFLPHFPRQTWTHEL